MKTILNAATVLANLINQITNRYRQSQLQQGLQPIFVKNKSNIIKKY